MIPFALLLPILGLLVQPSAAGPGWDETVDWIAGKLVGRSVTQQKNGVESVFTVRAVTGDGCRLLISNTWESVRRKSGRRTVSTSVAAFPVKDYVEIEATNALPGWWAKGSHLRLHSLDRNVEVVPIRNGKPVEAEKSVYTAVDIFFPADGYPDFVKRMDNALRNLGRLARKNPACGKRDIF